MPGVQGLEARLSLNLLPDASPLLVRRFHQRVGKECPSVTVEHHLDIPGLQQALADLFSGQEDRAHTRLKSGMARHRQFLRVFEPEKPVVSDAILRHAQSLVKIPE